MTIGRQLPLKFQVGARTVWSIRRNLIRVPLGLDDAIGRRLPVLPPLPPGADGYLVTSLPVAGYEPLASAQTELLSFVRQRYLRRYVDLTVGFDAYLAGLSGNTRSAVKRKRKKVALASRGQVDVRRFVTPEELGEFHGIARRLALGTYQERLMGAGLPGSPDFTRRMLAMAAEGRVRAWLLFVGGEVAAYLYCPLAGRTVIYEFVGHDPRFNDLSAGAVLQVEALRDLFDDPDADRFDFTEGDGQHKRQFATGGVECCDLLLLRPTLGNRAAIRALAGFDKGTAMARRAVAKLGLQAVAKKLLRA